MGLESLPEKRSSVQLKVSVSSLELESQPEQVPGMAEGFGELDEAGVPT